MTTTFAFQKNSMCEYMKAPYLTSRWTSWPRRAGPAQWSHPCARGHRHRASGCRLCVSVCPTHTQTWCVLLALECHKEWGPPWRQRSTHRSEEEKGEMRVRRWDKYFTSRQSVRLSCWNYTHWGSWGCIQTNSGSATKALGMCSSCATEGVLINITEPTEWRQTV